MAAQPFRWKQDTLAFENDTFWAYSWEPGQQPRGHWREKPSDYSRHCIPMSRTVLQFQRFVRFAPHEPKLARTDYRRMLRRIVRVPVWLPKRERFVVPGYANLRAFSGDHVRMFQEEIGHWWPYYFRYGNWRMALPFPRCTQERLASELVHAIDAGEIKALFLTRFRPLNHMVIAYAYRRLPDGDLQFLAADPNECDAPISLAFDRQSRSFQLQKTGYFPGGRVNVFETYGAPWQ